MEKGNVNIKGQMNAHFEQEETIRKDGKIIKKKKTSLIVNLTIFVCIAVAVSGAFATYIFGGFQNGNNKVEPQNLTFDSSTHNQIGQINTDNSTNYIYPNNNSSVTIDKSNNKFNSNLNNGTLPHNSQPQQKQIQPQAKSQVQPQVLQPPQQAALPKSSSPPIKQFEPPKQAKLVDFRLEEYLQKMQQIALTGRKIADAEQSLNACISKQNNWYSQTAPFLKDFQGYLQANYDSNYFLLQDSNLEPINSSVIFNAENCRQIFGAQGSTLMSLTGLIRLKLKDNLPNA